MALKTKGINVGSGNSSKTITPGNVRAYIRDIEMTTPVYDAEARILKLTIETEPLGEGFEGFLVDPEKPQGKRYLGQIGSVRANRYAYKDFELPNGITIERDTEILKFIGNLCSNLNQRAWFDDADGKYNTIEEFITAFRKSKVYKDTMLDFCVGGKEYLNKSGYKAYDLFLPKGAKGEGYSIVSIDNSANLLQFDKSKHILAMAAVSTASAEDFANNEDLDDEEVDDSPFEDGDDEDFSV
jgi:hypothetical protein